MKRHGEIWNIEVIDKGIKNSVSRKLPNQMNRVDRKLRDPSISLQPKHSPMDGIAFTGLGGGGIVGASKVFDSDEAVHGDDAATFGPFDFEELRFDVADDDRSAFADEIDRTKLRMQSWIDGLEVCHRKFEEFGRERIKATGIHPDTFLQVALQVAIYLTHKRLARGWMVSEDITRK